ncbi:MAG: protein-methionine-sulfoxide reductase heme-binding subunit MsrQ [Rhodospirillales bacterium]|nr:protein-methionine-sulfoxide reductase heme-binding subunit MsrQ [Rhodospirillales bacterium]
MSRTWGKPLVFIASLGPAIWLAWAAYMGELGANPIEYINRFLGDWALRFLILGLAITPVRKLTGLNALARFRRMIGLFGFFYASLHILNYIAIDQFFDWQEIWTDIIKRTYITVGMVAFLALIPLAVTSTNAMVKRLGGARWRKLHRLAYFAAPAACFHFIMMVKADLREPAIYSLILIILLALRLKKPKKKSPAHPVEVHTVK